MLHTFNTYNFYFLHILKRKKLTVINIPSRMRFKSQVIIQYQKIINSPLNYSTDPVKNQSKSKQYSLWNLIPKKIYTKE